MPRLHRLFAELLARRARMCAGVGILLVCSLATPHQALAQRSPAEQAADSQFTLRRWSAAAAAYKPLTVSNPTSGANWANLGESELQLQHLDEAIAAFGKAIDLNYRPYKSMIDQARAWAAKGDDVRMAALIEKVIDGGAGAALRPYILGAGEFSRVSQTAQFKGFVARMKPCTTAPYRQFDFWLGDWEVFGAAGGVAGHNVVTLEQDGCLVVEHWTSAAGGQTGTSFNFYDVRDKRWHQLYLDNSGNAGAFPAMAGTLTDGRMVMLTDDVNNTLSRWTWYVMEPGKVKQMQEVSSDRGATWQTVWNSVYVLKPSENAARRIKDDDIPRPSAVDDTPREGRGVSMRRW